MVRDAASTGSPTPPPLTAYPSGTTRPTASNLNFTRGWTGANSVTVPLGGNGKIDIYNEAGSVDVIADVLGYYLAADDPSAGYGGQFQPHETVRLVDTRDPKVSALPGGWSLSIKADYGAKINPHVRALAVNVTAVTPQWYGFLTAWDGTWNGSCTPPLASTLNFAPGAVVASATSTTPRTARACGSTR